MMIIIIRRRRQLMIIMIIIIMMIVIMMILDSTGFELPRWSRVGLCISMVLNVIRFTFIDIIHIKYIFIILCFSSVVIVFIYCWICMTRRGWTTRAKRGNRSGSMRSAMEGAYYINKGITQVYIYIYIYISGQNTYYLHDV